MFNSLRSVMFSMFGVILYRGEGFAACIYCIFLAILKLCLIILSICDVYTEYKKCLNIMAYLSCSLDY